MAGKLTKGQENKADELNAGEVSAEALTEPQACGALLRDARIEQELSTQAIAKQLRLSNKQIEALEADDFDALPEPTIVKGFIRNYAKLLKIPSDVILSGYAEMTPKAAPYAFGIDSGLNMKISEKSKSGNTRYLIFSVLFLLGLAAWIFYQSYIQKPEIAGAIADISEVLPSLNLQVPDAAQEVVLSEIPPEDASLAKHKGNIQDGVDASSDVLAEPAQSELDAATTDASEVISQEAESATEASTGDEATENANTAGMAAITKLAFNVTQETWLSVVNQKGKEVYNKILYAGNRDVVDVADPKEIVVGNARGATLMVDGKRLDLAPYTRSNVARVRLNQ